MPLNHQGSVRIFRSSSHLYERDGGLFIPMVIRLGFEPKTHSLEGCCSIQLSYRTIFGLISRIVVFCLNAYFHTQWSDHNHLSYRQPELLPQWQHHPQLNVGHRSLIPFGKLSQVLDVYFKHLCTPTGNRTQI